MRFMTTDTKKFNLAVLASQDACFDLQFRKDTRHERTNAPTYYRWKAQFIITGTKDALPVMQRVKRELACGNVHRNKNQVRFSVQNLSEIIEVVIPYFQKNLLSGNKKKDFEFWQKAVAIMYQNKGKHLAAWKKNDLHSLIELQKLSAKYKTKTREPRWIAMAQTLAKSL